MQRIGTLGDGGKWVCGMERIEEKRDCVIYSVGAPILLSPLSIVRRRHVQYVNADRCKW